MQRLRPAAALPDQNVQVNRTWRLPLCTGEQEQWFYHQELSFLMDITLAGPVLNCLVKVSPGHHYVYKVLQVV